MKLPTWELAPERPEDTRWAVKSTGGVSDLILRSTPGISGAHVLNEEGNVVGVWPPETAAPAYLPPDVATHVYGRRLFSGRHVHLFYNPSGKAWLLGTKKTIGAPIIVGHCGSEEITVARLFFEELISLGIALQDLDKSTTYSFLFAHKDDDKYGTGHPTRVVLLSTQELIKVNGVEYGVSSDWERESELRKLPVLPQQEIEDLRLLRRSLEHGTLCSECPGVLLSWAGRNYFLPNATHAIVHKLAGESPAALYAYIAHKKMKSVRKALESSPDRTKSWAAYNSLIRCYTGMLFQRYQEIYVLKSQTAESLAIDGHIGDHLWRLHQVRTSHRRPLKCTDVVEMLRRRPSHSVYAGILQYLDAARD